MDFPFVLQCPDDGARAGMEDGGWICPACRRRFAVDAGPIPLLSMLPAGAPHPGVLAEREQRDVESRGYDQLLGLRFLSRWEIPALLRAAGAAGSQGRAIDVGCGTGRLTLALHAAGWCVLAVDHSLESLRVLRAKAAGDAAGRLLLVQADAARLPIASAAAAVVMSAQALEHVPTPGLRRTVVGEMARVAAPGGRVALTAYRHWPWLRREGAHGGRIYYRRFDRREIESLLEPVLTIERLEGRLGYVWLAAGRPRSSGALDTRVEDEQAASVRVQPGPDSHR